MEVVGQLVLLANALPLATKVGEVEVEGVVVDSPGGEPLPCAVKEGWVVPVTRRGDGEAVTNSTLIEGEEEGETVLDAVTLWVEDSVPAATVIDGEEVEDPVRVVSRDMEGWALGDPLLLGLDKVSVAAWEGLAWLVWVAAPLFEVVWVGMRENETTPLPVLPKVNVCIGELDTVAQKLTPPDAVPEGPKLEAVTEGVEDTHALTLTKPLVPVMTAE